MYKADKRIFLSLVFFNFIFTPFLYAQVDTERGTRETDSLMRKEEELRDKLTAPRKEGFVKPEAKPEKPKKEEQKFFVKKIDLIGCESFSAKSFSTLVEKYENKEVTLTELNNLAREIEREYLRRGIIAAVFVPPQEIKEQVVNLRVVEAKLGELQVQKHDYYAKRRVYYYWNLYPGEILRYDKLSKSIQLMNKAPDRQIKAALRAGKKPGTTDIVLIPETHFPLHYTSSYDREGAATTGQSRTGYGFRHNNFLGLDDTLMAGSTIGDHFSGSYIYHNLPITPYGTSLLYGYNNSSSIPKKEFTPFALRSSAETKSVSVHQDIYTKDEYLGEVYFGFDAKNKGSNTNTGTSNRDKLRIFRLGGSYTNRGFGSVTSISTEISQGVDAFGASPMGNPYASRNARSRFTKFTLNTQYRKLLPLNLQASLKFKGQFATTKLMPQEEFGLGGIDSVRGYPADDYLADNAIFDSMELLIPAFFIPKSWRLPYAEESLQNQTTALIFVEHGYGKRRGALPTERKTVNYASVGGGIRVSLFNQALLRLEWGKPFGDRWITQTGKSRFHFSVDLQEKLPEEIARIRQLVEEKNIKEWAWKLINEELSRPNNPIKRKLYRNLYLAQRYHKLKKLEKSKEFYQKIALVGRSLYQQAEEYVKSCLAHEKELKDYQRVALTNYKEGKIAEAKQMWQKIIQEAKPKPLVFEF